MFPYTLRTQIKNNKTHSVVSGKPSLRFAFLDFAFLVFYFTSYFVPHESVSLLKELEIITHKRETSFAFTRTLLNQR